MDNQATEPTQTQLLERIKELRTPKEPEGQPEGEEVDASVEVPEVGDELEPKVEAEELPITEELEETVTAEGEEGESLYVEIDGEEISLDDIKEWKQGNLRQSDYTRKTQELAGTRKEVDAQRDQQKDAIDRLQSHIDTVSEMLDAEFEGVDWDELRELDTGEYLKLKEKKEGKQSKLDGARSKHQEALNGQLLELQTNANNELVQLNPAWVKDGQPTEAYTSDQKLLGKYATDNKLNPQEISAALSSSSIMQAMIDSSKYRANIAKAPALTKKVKQAPVVIKGKKASVTSIDRQVKAAEAKLKQTGKIEDAMALKKLKRQL